MNKNKLLRYLLIFALLLIIIAVVGKKAGWFGKPDSVKVAVQEVTRRTIIEEITANGKIQPKTEVIITPDVSGEIVELNIKEGDRVVKGKLLLKIKPDTYISQKDRASAALNTSQANLASAKARLVQVEAQFDQAKLSYERNKQLWQEKTISQSDWEQAESSFKVAQAEVQAARENVNSAEFSMKSAGASLAEAQEQLSKTAIYAPMSGTVSKLGVELGERVAGTNLMQGTEMLRIADLGIMEVQLEVNENDIMRISLKDTAVIEVDAYFDMTFKGLVTEIARSASIDNVTTDQVTNFEVVVQLLPESYQELVTKEKPDPFLPGMSATARIQTESLRNVLSVLIQAVTAKTDSAVNEALSSSGSAETDKKIVRKGELVEIVFQIQDNRVHLVPVETGIQDNNYIEIISGLKEGDKVVTAPYMAINKWLKEGSVIEIVEEDKLYNED